jgi:signal transduction histidine kinase
MARLFRRSVVWIAALALIPLSVLMVMQYRFLRRLEETTASAERNSLRNFIGDVSHEVDLSFRSAAEQALDLQRASLDHPESLSDHFRLAQVPGAKTYFAIRLGDPSEWSVFDARGRSKTLAMQEAQAIKLASASWSIVHHFGTPVATRSLSVDDSDAANRVIVRPITDESWRVAGVAGVVLDNELARAAISTMGAAAVKRRHHPDLMVRVGRPELFERRATGRREFITQPLTFAYMDWLMGVTDVCATPEEIAAINFRINALWTGSMAVLLFGALMLAIQATARQMKLSQMKSDFVSNVSHELRTPLSSIRVFGEYMRLGRVEKPEKIREYGEYIETESRRLTQLINNILDFSRIESAEKKYRFGECDAGEVVRETACALVVPLRERGFTVTIDVPPALPRVLLDREALAQALVNLLDNAVKYSGDKRTIEVKATGERGELRIAIRDHGIGIAGSEQKKIFEKFYRVGSGLVHDVKGSGLGLAIVNHIVKAHGGRVEVASGRVEHGDGSTFTIVLPCVAANEIAAAPTPTLESA